jgi:hypothetical protein
MGREGGTSVNIATTKDEIETHLEEHNKSERCKKKVTIETVASNEDDAKQVAEFEYSKLKRSLWDNFNIAVVVPFNVLDKTAIDIQLEPAFVEVEQAFQQVAAAAVLNTTVSSFAQCSRCESTINLSIVRANAGEGMCPVCSTSKSEDVHIPFPELWGGEAQDERNNRIISDHRKKSDRLNSMLGKIGKRDIITRSAKHRLFNSLAARTLFCQPAYANAVANFKSKVALLLPALDQAEALQAKGGDIHYLVHVSWLSSHDEWQYNSDMDSY